VFAVVGVALSLLLATRMNRNDGIKMAILVAIAAAHWLYLSSRGGKFDGRQV
jgi:hypothetical protein